MERRRSSRIIALEEKKQQERERRLALALEKKNDLANRDNRNNEKGKAIMDVQDESSDDSNEEYKNEGPTNRSHKTQELLISLIKAIQELRKHSENADTSGTNVTSLNGMQLKSILEIIIDVLQRNDKYKLFVEPVNPNVVENYYEIVKQPMDFGTMRAKLHDGMYTNLEQFKRDACLICSNAMNAYPPTSKYYKMAKDISGYTRWIFKCLSANHEHLDLEFSLNKKRPGRKPQNGKPKIPRLTRLSPKLAETRLTSPETNKRDMYWPTSKPLVAEFLYDNKPKIQLNINPSKYKDSLLRFVEGLGPIAQSVAAIKLEALKSQQLWNDDTPTQNLLENVLDTQMIVHQPTPQTPTQLDAFNAQTLSLALPFLNKPLTISGSTTQENRNINTMNNAGSVNIKDGGAHQGNKKAYTNDSWHACAAALLSNFFFNNDKGGNGVNKIECSNAKGTMNFSNGKMVSPHENASSLLGHVQDDNTRGKNHKLPLEVNKSGNTDQWNTYASMSNTLVTRSSSNVITHVHPTCVISGPQPKPLNYMLSGYKNGLSGLPLIPQPKSQNTMPSINLPELSLLPQPRLQKSMFCLPNNNLTELSFVSQPRPKDLIFGIPSNNLTEPSLVQYQQRLLDSVSSMNPLGVSPLSQPNQGRSISNRNLSGLTILPSQAANFSNESNTYLHGSSTPYQPGDFNAMLGSQDFNNSTSSMQDSYEKVLHQASPFTPLVIHSSSNMQMQVISQQNPYGPAPLQEPNSSSSLGMAIVGAMNHNGSGGVLVGQPKEATPPLLWNNDQQPSLALQL